MSDPRRGAGAFTPERVTSPGHLAKPLAEQGQGGERQERTVPGCSWPAGGSSVMPAERPAGGSCLGMQPMATPRKADKTFSTISPFICSPWAKGTKHSCQTQINV